MSSLTKVAAVAKGEEKNLLFPFRKLKIVIFVVLMKQ